MATTRATTEPRTRSAETTENRVAPARASNQNLSRLVGWQGFTLRVPDNWDLTGFTGTTDAGYFRLDDSTDQSLQIKWATEGKKQKTPPDVIVRRESYFRTLRQAAKKKKVALVTKDDDAPRGVLRGDRVATGFAWTGDQRGIGVVWHCETCRRTVIAEMVTSREGRLGIAGIADRIWATLSCHEPESENRLRTWSLFDLQTKVPKGWTLESQSLMNVFLRLTFAKGAARLSVEQWGLANVARKQKYLDEWLYSNTKGEMVRARYAVEETQVNGLDAIALTGGPSFFSSLQQPIRELSRLQLPATRYNALGWENEAENKIYLVQAFTRKKDMGIVREVAERTGATSLFGDFGNLAERAVS